MANDNKGRAETAIFFAFDDYNKHDPAEPEKTLMAAILKSALEDLKKVGAPARAAKEYMISNDRNYLYSFINVCLHLDICPKTVRALFGMGPKVYKPLVEREERLN